MTERRRSIVVRNVACAAIAMLWIACAAATGGEPQELERETREFKVSVDGKERGKCTMQIRCHDDGTERMQIDATLRFNYIVYEYRYASAGTEIWKDGRLIELENTADYNGTKYRLKAKPFRKGLQVAVNGKTSPAAADVWATSYWQLPERLISADSEGDDAVIQAAATKPALKEAPRSVLLLDSDKGQTLKGELKRIGEEKITVAGRREPCTHYQITGGVQVDLWYDAARRLVRQETIDSGHKTLMELSRVSAE